MPNANFIFYTLSDPTRRKILKLLQQQDLTPGQLVKKFQITKPSLTHHLNVLKQANLVTCERSGQYMYYSLQVSVFEEVVARIMDFLENIKPTIKSES